MTLQATLAQLIDILSAQSLFIPAEKLQQEVKGVTTDTRSLKTGEIFLALRGEQFDGHRFVEIAMQQGAIATIVDYPLDIPIPQLQVQDTLKAYQRLGQWWRQQFQIPIIAITGSVGKTTTKELVAAVLGSAGSVLKTAANYNNEIGVPKTLLELRADHDYAVIEMGMRASGEIAELTQIACPDIGVITNVGTAHIGRLGSREAIANAKCELLAQMPAESLAILNADNSLLIETAKTVWNGSLITYGLESGDLQGTLVNPQTLLVEGMEFSLPLSGTHNVLNYLAALAIARHLHIDLAPLQAGLTLQLPPGRSRKLVLPKDVILLDETYNAGLESMQAALQLLAQTPGQRHIAVLGPMKELGDYAPQLHRQVGQLVEQLQLDQLLILDTGSEGTALAAGANSVPTEQFADHQDLIDYLQIHIQGGDRLLFKASHSVGLDRVVDGITQFKA
jgi:UDP-N-acetylmuramoyl-tripeptide--D-alanyl-D-alanine ligase